MKYIKQTACLGMVCVVLAACGGQDPKEAVRVLERRLAQIAGQANGAAPAEVDANTRLDGVKAGPGLRLTSSYTLLNPAAEGIDSTTFGTKLTPTVQEGSCKNPDLRPLIDRGVIVVLEYRGTDGNPIGTVSINRDTCTAFK